MLLTIAVRMLAVRTSPTTIVMNSSRMLFTSVNTAGSISLSQSGTFVKHRYRTRQGLTIYKISDDEPTATSHAAEARMVNTHDVSRMLARGSLHRRVTCFAPHAAQPGLRILCLHLFEYFVPNCLDIRLRDRARRRCAAEMLNDAFDTPKRHSQLIRVFGMSMPPTEIDIF